MRKLLAIVGPTATGKTSLGISLAKTFNGELISADSRQVYKYLDIGTGKDLSKNADGVKIWLYDVVDPGLRFSAGEYMHLAGSVIEDIWKRGKLPIIVGGTGFYIKALLGEQELSSVDADWELRDELEKLRVTELQQKLNGLDDLKLSKMNDSDRQNPRRLIRAIEIAKKIQNPKSKIQKSDLKVESLLKVGLSTDKKELYKKIDLRVKDRYKEGIITEIEGLLKNGYSWEDPGLNSLGYWQWKLYLEGKSTKDEVIERWKYDEHKYASRQLTYFKKDRQIVWFDISQPDNDKLVQAYVHKWYDNSNIMDSPVAQVGVSYRTVVYTILTLLSLWILFVVRDVIFLLMAAFVVMAGLRPFVDRIEKFKIPRSIAIVLTYVILASVIALIATLIIPSLVSQFQKMLEQLQEYILPLLPFLESSTGNLTDQIPKLSQNVLKITTGVFSTVIGFFTFGIITFYMLVERRHFKTFLDNLIGRKAERKVSVIIVAIERKLGAWVIGQLALAVIVGVITYIGLTLLGVEFALSLSIIAGIFEIVPIIGPIISAIPAVLVALTMSPMMALLVAGLFFVVQQLENNIFVPIVMRRAVGIPPIVTILALAIGGKLAGVAGIMLAVPLVVAMQVIFQSLVIENEK